MYSEITEEAFRALLVLEYTPFKVEQLEHV